MRKDSTPFPDVDADARIDGYSPAFVDVDGTKTRYYHVGSGDPLVLLHGGTWSGYASANAWSRTFNHFADRFQVLAFDRIGCGLTENPERPEDYVYETDLAHALGFLDAMDIDTCHLAGFSRGGGLAARMAVETPERFRTLIINNSATLGPPVTDNEYRRENLFSMDELGLEPTDPEYVRRYYEQYSYQTGYVTDHRCRTDASMHRRPKFETAVAILEDTDNGANWFETLAEHMSTVDTRVRRGILDMPVLYVYGLNDLTVPLEMAMGAYQLIASVNPAARLTVMNKCGHMGFLEHPAEFSHIVTNFITHAITDRS